MTTPDIDTLARCCHEANRALCESFGDHSQLPWEDAPGWQHDASRDMVRWCLAHPQADAEALHDEWVAHKQADGWQHGPVKDATLRTHPDMLPFDKLPALTRAKDALFIAIVRALS